MRDIVEIQQLVKKGTGNLNRFFYVGIVIGVVMGPSTLLASRIPAVQARMTAEDLRWLTIFGVGMTVLFGIAIIEQIVKYRKDTLLLRQLRQNPHDIVWAYKEISEGRVQHRAGSKGARVARYVHACFHMVDGQKVTVWLREQEVDRLIALLRTALPHMTIGYSKEVEEVYKQSPEHLRTQPQQIEGVKRVSGGVRM